MKIKKVSKGRKPQGSVALRDVEGVAAAIVVGGVVGAAAGPPGIVAGAILGGVAGAAAAVALEENADQQSERARELDAEVGVSGGELGAPNLKHPPATRGAYSAASAGVATSTGNEVAEGPMQTPES